MDVKAWPSCLAAYNWSWPHHNDTPGWLGDCGAMGVSHPPAKTGHCLFHKGLHPPGDGGLPSTCRCPLSTSRPTPRPGPTLAGHSWCAACPMLPPALPSPDPSPRSHHGASGWALGNPPTSPCGHPPRASGDHCKHCATTPTPTPGPNMATPVTQPYQPGTAISAPMAIVLLGNMASLPAARTPVVLDCLYQELQALDHKLFTSQAGDYYPLWTHSTIQAS